MKPKAETSIPEAGTAEVARPADDVPSSLLELALSPAPRAPVEGIVVGRVVSVDEIARVTFPDCADPLGVPARTMVRLDRRDQGAEVALMFECGDIHRPCVLGRMASSSRAVPEVEVARDGERLVLGAEREIVLQCGEASITLTRAGKVIIRGAYVVSASTGVNRILGGSVEIN
jgi:hypothetical protein